MSDSIFFGELVRTPSRHNPRGLPHAPPSTSVRLTAGAAAAATNTHSSAPANTPAALPSSPPAEERPSTPMLIASPATLRTPTTVASSNDAALVGVLDAPLLPGETAREGFLRKEAELRASFAQLPVVAQRALHTRLSNPRAGDQLAERFMRLTADRRTRLLTFLADARRREALAQATNR